MKKLLLALFVIAFLSTSAMASELRIIVDIQSTDASFIMEIINLIEQNKDKLRKVETLDQLNPEAKVVETWDTESNNDQEAILYRVDFSGQKKTHPVPQLRAIKPVE